MQPRHFIEDVYDRIRVDAANSAYVRQVHLGWVSSEKDVQFSFCGAEINPAIKAFILSADQEVLFQFYKYNHCSDAGRDIKEALIELNEKARLAGKLIQIKFYVNHRSGLAAHATKSYPDPFNWLLYPGQGQKSIELNNKIYFLANLNIETKLRKHQLFDSYHAKQMIVDKKRVMYFSGDPDGNSNYKNGQQLSAEVATTVHSVTIAESAAISFEARFYSNSKVSYERFSKRLGEGEGGIPFLLLEKNPSTDFLKKIRHNAPYKLAVINAIRQAGKEICILISNINDPEIIDALIEAVRRNVVVKLVTGKFHNQKEESYPSMGGSNLDSVYKMYDKLPLQYWDKLRVRWACNNLGELILDRTEYRMHGKGIVVDGKILVAGSSPMDKQASYFSGEIDYMVESEAIVARFIDHVFNPVFDRSIDSNEGLFSKIKNTIVNRVLFELIFSEEKILRGRAGYADLVVLKQNHKDKLVASLLEVKTYHDIYVTLVGALDIVEANPFAITRRISFFNDKVVSRTASIDFIAKLIDEHFINKRSLADIQVVELVGVELAANRFN